MQLPVPCLIILTVLVISSSRTQGICQRKEVFGNLIIPNHLPLPLRYNVCVDNTTISPQPSMARTGTASFLRACCGCRVSSVTERELRLQTISLPASTRSVYLPEIRSCECIPCDSNVYNFVDYFRFLNY